MASVSNGSGHRRAASVLHLQAGGDWPDDVVPDEEDGDSALMLIAHTLCAPGGAFSCALRSRRHNVDWVYSQVREPRLQFALVMSMGQVYNLDVQGGVWGLDMQVHSAIDCKEYLPGRTALVTPDVALPACKAARAATCVCPPRPLGLGRLKRALGVHIGTLHLNAAHCTGCREFRKQERSMPSLAVTDEEKIWPISAGVMFRGARGTLWLGAYAQSWLENVSRDS
jgi:hypothetical protein